MDKKLSTDYLAKFGTMNSLSTDGAKTGVQKGWNPANAEKNKKKMLFKKITAPHYNSKGAKVAAGSGTTAAKSIDNAIRRSLVDYNQNRANVGGTHQETFGQLVYILELTGKNLSDILDIIVAELKRAEGSPIKAFAEAGFSFNDRDFAAYKAMLNSSEYTPKPIRLCGETEYKLGNLLKVHNINLGYLYFYDKDIADAVNKYIFERCSYWYGGEVGDELTNAQISGWMKKNHKDVYDRFRSDIVHKTQYDQIYIGGSSATLYEMTLLGKMIKSGVKVMVDGKAVKETAFVIVDSRGNPVGESGEGQLKITRADLIDKLMEFIENKKTLTVKGEAIDLNKLDITGFSKRGDVKHVDLKSEYSREKEYRKGEVKVYLPTVRFVSPVNRKEVEIPEGKILVKSWITPPKKAGSKARPPKVPGERKDYIEFLETLYGAGTNDYLDALNTTKERWDAVESNYVETATKKQKRAANLSAMDSVY